MPKYNVWFTDNKSPIIFDSENKEAVRAQVKARLKLKIIQIKDIQLIKEQERGVTVTDRELFMQRYRTAAKEEMDSFRPIVALQLLADRLAIVRTEALTRREEKIAVLEGLMNEYRAMLPAVRTSIVVQALLLGITVVDAQKREFKLQKETNRLMVKVYIENTVTGAKTSDWHGANWTDAWAELGSFVNLADSCLDSEIDNLKEKIKLALFL